MKDLKPILLFILTITFALTSCDKEDPEIPHEEEVITTLLYTLTPSNGGTAVEFTFKDLDGDGGADPVYIGGVLDSNMTYSASLVLLNEQNATSENITTEILEEDEEHQFFFETNLNGLTIDYDDQDANGNPLGIQSTVSTSGVENGTLTITLRHEPDKSASGVSNGDISNAGGETDIEVTFDIEVR